jgi:DNA-binding NarL/FixJ family response regulator
MSRHKLERFTLSKQEIRILDLVKRGATTHEIAAQLFISRHTVHAHFSNIHQKLELDPGTSILQGLARRENEKNSPLL